MKNKWFFHKKEHLQNIKRFGCFAITKHTEVCEFDKRFWIFLPYGYKFQIGIWTALYNCFEISIQFPIYQWRHFLPEFRCGISFHLWKYYGYIGILKASCLD